MIDENTDIDCLRLYVDEYIYTNRMVIRAQFLSFKNESCLKDAVSRAAMSEDENGKRNSHQRRIPKKCLEQARSSLMKSKGVFTRLNSFEKLFELVNSKIQPIHGIGDLAIYDIALRIGAHLELYPNKVYLQRGSLEGAKALGIVKQKRYISPNELPEELSLLEPFEIEDFLCIYKNRLSGESSNPNRGCCQRPTKPPKPCR